MSVPKRKASDRILEILSTNVKRLRKDKKLSQEKLAESCGYHWTFISAIERKKKNVSLSTIEILAEALDVTPSDLLK